MSQIRQLDYQAGRYFLSPILGCNAQCQYCYIYEEGYKKVAKLNQLNISRVIEDIKSHLNFIHGPNGSIISIGAWGDPFPRGNDKAIKYSLKWLEEACKIGNPIQIMSRFKLDEQTINLISNLQSFTNQILFSTSITTTSQHKELEPFADSPDERFETLNKLKKVGIQTNVMIKPFIKGVTDRDEVEIIGLFKKWELEVCVVGGLYENTSTLKLEKTLSLTDKPLDIYIEVLDCSSDKNYKTIKPNEMYVFSEKLISHGIRAFRKSSCVNSFLSNSPNPAGYFLKDPYDFCIKCGVCD